MDSLHKRRLLHARRTRRKKGMPWWLTALLGMAILGSVGAAAAIGALFITYQAYADDYVPIEDKLRQTNIGLTTIYDRNDVELGALTNPDAQLLRVRRRQVAVAALPRELHDRRGPQAAVEVVVQQDFRRTDGATGVEVHD